MKVHQLKIYGKFLTVLGSFLFGLGIWGIIHGVTKGIVVIALGLMLSVTAIYLAAGRGEKAKLVFYSIGAVASVVVLFLV